MLAKAEGLDDRPMGVGQGTSGQGCSPLFATLNQNSHQIGILNVNRPLLHTGKIDRSGSAINVRPIRRAITQLVPLGLGMSLTLVFIIVIVYGSICNWDCRNSKIFTLTSHDDAVALFPTRSKISAIVGKFSIVIC